MLGYFACAVISVMPFGHLYLAKNDYRNTVILPANAVPMSIGGWLPPPDPPSDELVMAMLADSGRQPGDVILFHNLVVENVSAPRFIRMLGPARVWELTYHAEIIGPDGRTSIYIDRTVLIRVP